MRTMGKIAAACISLLTGIDPTGTSTKQRHIRRKQ